MVQKKGNPILSVNYLHVIKWYVDTAFSVHAGFKIHAGGIMTNGS